MEQILLGSILGISFADDLKFKKVHNVLILGFLIVSLSFLAFTGGFAMFQIKSLAIAVFATMPLVYARILGAGDFKLYLVLALFFTPTIFTNLLILSLFWNALAGSIKYSVNLVTKSSNKKEALSFPFTLGILLAWLSLAYLPPGALL